MIPWCPISKAALFRPELPSQKLFQAGVTSYGTLTLHSERPTNKTRGKEPQVCRLEVHGCRNNHIFRGDHRNVAGVDDCIGFRVGCGGVGRVEEVIGEEENGTSLRFAYQGGPVTSVNCCGANLPQVSIRILCLCGMCTAGTRPRLSRVVESLDSRAGSVPAEHQSSPEAGATDRRRLPANGP